MSYNLGGGITVADALLFVFGSFVGASLEIAANFKAVCYSEISAGFVAAYHMFYFIVEYKETENLVMLGWSAFFIYKIFERRANLQCVLLENWTQ